MHYALLCRALEELCCVAYCVALCTVYSFRMLVHNTCLPDATQFADLRARFRMTKRVGRTAYLHALRAVCRMVSSAAALTQTVIFGLEDSSGSGSKISGGMFRGSIAGAQRAKIPFSNLKKLFPTSRSFSVKMAGDAY